MTTTAPSYGVCEGHATHSEGNAVAAWERCRVDLPGSGPEFRARYQWMYRDNPAAPAQLYFLKHGAEREDVGFVTVAGRAFEYDGRALLTGLLIDFVVDPKHRTAFPALLLQRHVHQAGLQGKALLYGIPDTKAVPIFKRLSCSFNLPIPRFVRITRFGKYVGRKLPAPLAAPVGMLIGIADRIGVGLTVLRSGCKGSWVDSFDERFDELWKRAGKPGTVVGRRDAAFLRWRFGRPDDRMKIYAVGDSGAAGIHTYFVGRVEADAFVVKDVLSAATGATLVGALHSFVQAARALGVNSLSMSVLPDAQLRQALDATRFVERDHRVCFWTLSTTESAALQGASWYLTPADEDM